MSLINDMLRNIEAKRPDDPTRQSLQREIRSLPAEPSRFGWPLKLLVLLGLPLAGAAALHANGQLLPLLGLDMERIETPVVPPPSPVIVVAAPAVATSPPPGSSTVNGEKQLNSENDLRLAPMLANLPLLAAPVLSVPDPVAPPPAVVSAKVELVPAVTEAPKPVPAGPVKIEKSPVMATARDRADAEYRKAENAQVSGRSAEAIEGFKAALKQDTTHVQARQALLRLQLEMRKTEDAMLVLQEGLELQPAQSGWAMSLARLQLEHNDLAAADRTLTKSQAYAEASADYAGFQGHLKSRMGAHRSAVMHYQRAVRLAPAEGRWWLGLGLALEADARLPEARDAFRRSVATGNLSADLAALAEQHLH